MERTRPKAKRYLRRTMAADCATTTASSGFYFTVGTGAQEQEFVSKPE